MDNIFDKTQLEVDGEWDMLCALISLPVSKSSYGEHVGDYREFIATKTEWRNQLLHATEGKALDLLSTLIWLVDLDMSHVVIELDCKCVVDKLLHARNDISKLGAILKECKSISSLFPNFVVKFA
ncbi:hypothetical protein JHK86_055348 [Glycine max]|nr:hypothetical protein JHK86_055348 [Glycine max]